LYGVRPFISDPPHRFKRVALYPILAAPCANATAKFEWSQEVIGALFALNSSHIRREFHRFLLHLLATPVLGLYSINLDKSL
jgi:hypothetical protein